MKIRDTAIGLFLVVLMAGLGWLWFSPSGIRTVPEVNLTMLDGSSSSLAQYKNKPLLITFWATTCPGCIKEMPHLIELYKELAPRGLEIIGIAMHYDPPEHVKNMISSRGVPYKIALDTNKAVMNAFAIRELTPNSFLIDPAGRIVYHKVGEMDLKKVHAMINEMLSS